MTAKSGFVLALSAVAAAITWVFLVARRTNFGIGSYGVVVGTAIAIAAKLSDTSVHGSLAALVLVCCIATATTWRWIQRGGQLGVMRWLELTATAVLCASVFVATELFFPSHTLLENIPPESVGRFVDLYSGAGPRIGSVIAALEGVLIALIAVQVVVIVRFTRARVGAELDGENAPSK
ncbi:MAG: hypothetical protein KDC46_05815 [Thermoleophilia bacterium]|nr:hypothetical protein [Thermoleophilia bacterium]